MTHFNNRIGRGVGRVKIMAEPTKTTTPVQVPAPAPKQNQVAIPVPAGMTAENFAKLIATFVKGNDRGKKVGKAIGETIKILKENHKDEYRNILREQYVKQGLDPVTIK